MFPEITFEWTLNLCLTDSVELQLGFNCWIKIKEAEVPFDAIVPTHFSVYALESVWNSF